MSLENDKYYGVSGVSDIFNFDAQKGIASISQIEFKTENDPLYNFRMLRDAGRMFVVRDGKYVRLHVNGELMMSDTGMERISNREFIEKANGRVLIAGLGIGLILKNILDKKSVGEIVIIEKYKDVIDLVAPKFKSNKITIIHADIFDWKPPKGEKFDTIYFDIWPEITSGNLKEIKFLHNRFKNFKAPGAWMNSWMKEYLQKEKRKYRRW